VFDVGSVTIILLDYSFLFDVGAVMSKSKLSSFVFFNGVLYFSFVTSGILYSLLV
jgi:hypothetical protein